MRRTGIEVVGGVPWGTHFCQFYETAEDLAETLVPYFREGLAQNEFCMWITAAPFEVGEAKAALRAAVPDLDRCIKRGQIEVLDYKQWFLPSRKFQSDEVLLAWMSKLNSALERGFEGLRLTGDTFWLEEAVWKDFKGYEAAINGLIGRYRMLAVCTYSLRKCGAPEIIDVIANHQFALIRRQGRWEIIEDPEHKKTQQALRESEEQYPSLFKISGERLAYLASFPENNPNPVVEADSDGNVLYSNPAALRLFPDLAERRLEHPWLADWASVAGPFLEGRTEAVVRLVTLGGRSYQQTLHGGTQGRFVRIYAHDITESRRAEQALRLLVEEERLRLAAAVEQASESIIMAGQDGMIQYVNSAFEKINRRREEEVLGKSYFDFLVREPREKDIREAFGQGGQWTGRLTRNVGDGETRELDVAISPVRDPSGKILSFLIVERDITREVKLQQHLRQAQKAEAIGTLAGGIAHDFNNILSTIAINTELALFDMDKKSQAQSPLPLVLKAVRRGKDLVKQIITFSRQREQERRPIAISPVLKEALNFLRSSLPRSVEIQEEILTDVDTVLADPSQIHQILINLCNNAAYAMRETGGRLGVRLAAVEVDAAMTAAHPDLAPGPYLRLTVSDTGQGMTPEVMDRMYDPFFTTKKPAEGTGLGLSVVQGIVRSYGGAITAYSKAGEGSTFNVFLPRIKDVQRQERILPGTIRGGTERVLLVEDEEVQLESFRNALRKLGYQVTARTSSLQALAEFRADPNAFDLVITDQTMPQMTGTKLTEEMLKIRPGLPVILCTGFSDVVSGEDARLLGVREFVMKPFSIGEIAAAIRRALGE